VKEVEHSFSVQGEILNVATECANLQLSHKCSHNCEQCIYYTNRYLPMSDAQHDLLLMYGARRSIELKRQGRAHILPLAILGIIAALIIGRTVETRRPRQSANQQDIANSFIQSVQNHANDPRPQVTIERPRRQITPYPEEPPPTTTSTSVSRSTLTAVLKQNSSMFLSGNRDVNRDGLMNCIDASVTFYELWPDKNTVHIVRNKNPAKDFNHLFIEVLVDGRWIAVEPQRADGSMATWGSAYVPSLNIDETALWTRYVR